MSTCCQAQYPGSMSETVMAPKKLALRELLAARCVEFQVLLDGYDATNPKLFGSVARGAASAGSDIDILVEMDPAEGNLLMRASGLLEETRALFGCDDIDVSLSNCSSVRFRPQCSRGGAWVRCYRLTARIQSLFGYGTWWSSGLTCNVIDVLRYG